MLTDVQIAVVVHEANRAYCQMIGDQSQKSWEDAEDWQRESAIKGVADVRTGRAISPEQQHDRWCEEKTRTGWVFGPTKNATLKTHPCLVPYDELPREQQVKDHLFRAIVSTLLGGVSG